VETYRIIYYIKSNCCDIQGCNTNCAFVGCKKITIQVIYDHAMIQADSRRPLTVEARVLSQVSLCEIGDKVSLGQVFLRVLRFSPVNIISPVLHTHVHLQVVHTRRTNGRRRKNFQKAMLFKKSGALGRGGKTFTRSLKG